MQMLLWYFQITIVNQYPSVVFFRSYGTVHSCQEQLRNLFEASRTVHGGQEQLSIVQLWWLTLFDTNEQVYSIYQYVQIQMQIQTHGRISQQGGGWRQHAPHIPPLRSNTYHIKVFNAKGSGQEPAAHTSGILRVSFPKSFTFNWMLAQKDNLSSSPTL